MPKLLDPYIQSLIIIFIDIEDPYFYPNTEWNINDHTLNEPLIKRSSNEISSSPMNYENEEKVYPETGESYPPKNEVKLKGMVNEGNT